MKSYMHRVGILIMLVTSLSACATLMNGSTQKVTVKSEPAGATVKVEPGYYDTKTPVELTLKRGDGPYRLTITMDGYEPYHVYIKASTSGWVWGNILIGGIIGIAIDYSTGAATKLDTKEVFANLKKNGITEPSNEDGVFLFRNDGRLLAAVNLE